MPKTIKPKDHLRVEEWSYDDLQKLPCVPNQRNHEVGYKKKHYLRSFQPPHLIISLARVSAKEIYVIDGNTRLETARRGLADHLKTATFVCLVYSVKSEDEAEALYHILDQKKASKNSSDEIFGSLRALGIMGTSDWCKNAAFGDALNKASEVWIPGKGLNPSEYKSRQSRVALFSDAICIMDDWNIDVTQGKNLMVGFLAAAFLAVKKHGDDASEFWKNFDRGYYSSKKDGNKDCVAHLTDYIQDQRAHDKVAGAGPARNHMKKALACYSQWYSTGDALTKKQPRAMVNPEKFVKM